VNHFGSSSISVYLYRGGGLLPEALFHAPVLFSPSVQDMALGDLNGDGCVDLAVAGELDRLVVMYGRNCSCGEREP
jgi:hypothetical protein